MATIAVLSLAMLPLSIGSASADDTSQPSPSASPTQDISTPPASTPQDSPSANTPSAPAPSEAAPTTDAGSSAPADTTTKTIIVTFDKAQSDPAQAAEAAVAKAADQVADAKVTKVAPITNSMVAVTLDSPLSATETDKIETQVSDAKGVKAAQGSGWFRPATTNDAEYDRLWNLNTAGTYGVHAEDAWGTTTGEGTVVGVIDTGITAHPDLTGSATEIVGGNVISGYDFISDARTAGDGNGRDNDPSDTGDFTSAESSSWHGTHVAGIIAALANNGIGVAGVAPNAKVEPLRVLGRGGGDEADVIAAIYWGAGLTSSTLSRLPTNTRPADVLNLSLGMTGTCSPAMQTAINAATAKGVIVVVAAGNGDADGNPLPVSTSSPANCKNVISVGSTDNLGHLASYSNYGGSSELTISAPGDEVPSTVNLGNTTPTLPGYRYMSGTSMAAPHVAATVALLKSVDSTLVTSQVTGILKSTAKAGCAKPACGSGIVQAGAAVATLSSNIQSAQTASIQGTDSSAIAGTPRVGSTLSASSSTPLISATFSYQWSRDGEPIASGSTLVLTTAELGKTIRVRVTGSLAGYSWSSESPATSPVARGILAKRTSPKASGTFKKGRTVTASKGTWSPSPSHYSYRWLRNGKSITGATKSKYKLTSKDRGKRISVRVTVTKAGYTTASATSSTHKVKR